MRRWWSYESKENIHRVVRCDPFYSVTVIGPEVVSTWPKRVTCLQYTKRHELCMAACGLCKNCARLHELCMAWGEGRGDEAESFKEEEYMLTV